MKKLSFLFLMAVSTSCFSQLYIGSGSNLYAKNEVLYVQQNLQLQSNSNLYLRNEAQLVQGGNSLSGNVGLGSLSVYQEGTSDNYDYNYWCSPVGTPSNTAGNASFGISLLSRPETSTLSTPATILPAANYDGTAVPLAIASSWIYKLTNANSYSQWIAVGGASTIAPGEGFTMKGTSGTDLTDPAGIGVVNNPGGFQRYDFRGKPNNGNISVTLGAGSATLTGNPYPSALNLNAFLLDSDNLTITGGTAYFWQQDRNVNSHYLSAYRGGYGSYSPVSVNSEGIYVPPTFNAYKQDGTPNPGPGTGTGTVLQRRYAPIGQGFLLNGTANGTATFKNVHRLFFREGAGISQFEKKSQQLQTEENAQEAEPVSYFRLNAIINSQFTRQLALAFLPEATDGADPGIDALNMTADLPEDVNFRIGNASYLIQGIAFDSSKKIPLSVKASKETSLQFYIAETVNFDASQPVFLYDSSDNSYHDIRNASYAVTVLAGNYTDRFSITFRDQTLGLEDNPSTEQFVVYQDKSFKMIWASNPQQLPIRSLVLYDMSGKKVLQAKGLQTEPAYSFSAAGLPSGVYIAEFLTDDNQKITKKILLSTKGNK